MTYWTRGGAMSAIAFVLALSGAQAAAQSEAREYPDGERGTVFLPQGERSFADAVVSYQPGSGTIVESARDPAQALGAPDFSGNVNDGSFVSLGCDGVLVLQFLDNALVDVEGPDLYVFEVGPNVEGTQLSVSGNGVDWLDIGDISGGRSEVDLAGIAAPGDTFRYVRLTDDGIDCGTNFAGADIDAVAAIGSAMRFVLDGSVLFDHDSTALRDEAIAALDGLAGEIAAANLPAVQVVGHTDSTGSDAYNLALSEARALAVRDYLAERGELSGVSITSVGRGESEPVADNDTDEGRSQNRRVEIVEQ